ncbi:putative kelch repeat and BTB domain-containing protein 5/10 [Paratrimastix pyriformis]|uniref:Kelch repeat and BTB domain-containing protein 5/10 n=1 Tax=Paratrimastix pyriformis TaxID=342808 RepID=A0ABQ8UMF8_9EUKA|nr:putative kelch repeat and BTB domain-containing protein 5/10 [Paratrimastix pyriformis]
MSCACPPGVQALLNVLEELYKNQFNSDVIFVLAEGQKITAHRAIVSAWSAPLRMMVQQKTDRGPKEILLPQTRNPVAFSAFLHFLYTGSIEIQSVEEGADALEMAERFQTPSLTLVVEALLHDMIAVDTCTHICRVALKYSLQNLRKAAIDYAAAHFAQVAPTPGFLELDSSSLTAILEQDDLDVDSEEKVFEAVMRQSSSSRLLRFHGPNLFFPPALCFFVIPFRLFSLLVIPFRLFSLLVIPFRLWVIPWYTPHAKYGASLLRHVLPAVRFPLMKDNFLIGEVRKHPAMAQLMDPRVCITLIGEVRKHPAMAQLMEVFKVTLTPRGDSHM